MIPKIVHYCWFGNNDLDEKAQKCINSWKKHLPDYEIVLWNEKNFDISQNQFVKQAYEQRKFAFVSDYVRLYVLYKYGGIYMDTDVEVVKPFGDLLDNRAFTGNEDVNNCVTGTMGSEKNHPWIKLLLNHYEKSVFLTEEGLHNVVTNTVLITKTTIEEYGWKKKDVHQSLKDGLEIYPSDYFCAKSFETGRYFITNNTFTIHHFNGSWLTKEQILKKNIIKLIRNFIPNRVFSMIVKIYSKMKF